MNSRIIQFPKVRDTRGNLTFIENFNHIPFEIKRVFWTYDVPGGERRGGHAYNMQQEVIIAVSGSFDVIVNNGKQEQRFHLNRSYNGLYLPNLVWRHLEDFSTNSIVLTLSSSYFDESDYIRNFDQFLKIINL